jgi:GTPase
MNSDEFVGLFGSDDEEKFFNKNDKRKRKISYQPNSSKTKPKNKKKKERKKNLSVENKEKLFNSDNSLIPADRKISLDISKFKLEKRNYDIEYDYGNIEYKLKLCDVNVQRIQELTTQMKFRLGEGHGECYYEIGVEDNGYTLGISQEELEISLSVINTIANNLGCKAKVTKLIQGEEGLIGEMYIKKQEDNYISKIEITIGVLGEEGTGKSTLIGVLINGKLDNGKGLSRTNVLRHKHEILCGKTSSFSHQILGFDEKGELTNYGDFSLSQIVSKSTKIINFYDMAGSPKTFNRTTVSALSNEYLDYLLFVISANKPITDTTENLLRFIYNVDLPVITIINKIDLISDEDLKKVVKKYKEIIKKLNSELNKQKIPLVMKDNDDVALFSSNMDEKEILEIFLVSNLTWEGGLTLFKNFLGVLPDLNKTSDKQKQKELELEKMEFDVHEVIYKENKETHVILVGIVSSGKLRIKSKCFLGPDINGNFKIVEVCDIHCKKVNVPYSFKGQYCSVSIKSIGNINTLTRDNVKKGMSLLDIRNTPIASRLFEIEIWTIDDSTKSFKASYQPILNIKHIRQGVKIKNPDELFFFLSDNKKINDLENIIENDEITLYNVKDKIGKLIEDKKKKNKNTINNNNNNNIKKLNDINNNNAKNLKVIQNKNHQKEIENELFNVNDEITIGPADKKTKLVVEFLFNPEYISVGQKIIINDQSLKACGVITKIFK